MRFLKYVLLAVACISLTAVAGNHLKINNQTPLPLKVKVSYFWASETENNVEPWKKIETTGWAMFTKVRVLYNGEKYMSTNGTLVTKGFELGSATSKGKSSLGATITIGVGQDNNIFLTW